MPTAGTPTPTSQRVSAIYMDTLVSIEIIGAPEGEATDGASRALHWFEAVEACSSRFDESSELTELCRGPIGAPVSVSPMLFTQIEFALAVAEATGGAFDPTVGRAMELRGFDRNYLTEEHVRIGVAVADASFHDIAIDRAASTVTLRRPVVLDLGAVAKGLAIDLAARELEGYDGFAVFAGGDVRVGGRPAPNEAWRIGVRHPRRHDDLLDSLIVKDAAVCTSGDYERSTKDAQHHILEPVSATSARQAASATVIAPSAMVADALSTAAFVLGPEAGIAFLEREHVQGIIVTPELEVFTTAGIQEYRA